MRTRRWVRAVVAAAVTVSIAACSSDAQDTADPPADTAAADSTELDDEAVAPESDEELDERGPAPEVVPYEELTIEEQDSTQDLCAEVSWGDAIEALAQGPSDDLPEYLEWVASDTSGEERERLLALTAACAEIGWPPEM